MSISVIGIGDGGEGSAGQADEGPAGTGTMLVGYGSEDKVRPLRPARVCCEILHVCVCACARVYACVRGARARALASATPALVNSKRCTKSPS